MNDWINEEQDERDCITCPFEEYEYWRYPCCEFHGGEQE